MERGIRVIVEFDTPVRDGEGQEKGEEGMGGGGEGKGEKES